MARMTPVPLIPTHARASGRPSGVRRRVAAWLAAITLVLVPAAYAQGAPATDAPSSAEAWLDVPLVDAATGEVFTLRDLDDSVVLVETMATWCGNCRRQLGHLAAAAAELGGEAADGVSVAYVVVSLELGLAPSRLTAYAEREGFPFRFVVADEDLIRALADRFGRPVLNPPATPHVVVGPGGRVGELTTGFEAPEALVARLRAAAD
jgi:thiol-disulfide isomerase/thioredoxin